MRVCVCVIFIGSNNDFCLACTGAPITIPIGSNNDFCLACTGAPITIVDVSSMLYSTVVAC